MWFTCEVTVGQGRSEAEFLVIKGKGVSLGKDTAMKLGVLKTVGNIATVAEIKQTLQ